MKYLSILLFLFLFIVAACSSETNYQLENADEVLVCKSTTAESYHRKNCSALKQCSHKVGKMNIEEAKSSGRKPCGRCY